MPPEDACYAAVQARDPRFDGRFVTAVQTTGIYCRPICPARTPKRGNVRFLPTAAAAEAAGYRACLRCRPDRAVWSASARGDTLVARALRRIDGMPDPERTMPALAADCGVSVRQLDRVFRSMLGTTPAQVARTRRLHFARRLLETTDRPVTEVAFAAGFGSLRRFHAAFREAFDATPSALRAVRGGGVVAATLEFELPDPGPVGVASILAFHVGHAVAGLECGDRRRFRRILRDRGECFGVEISLPAGGGAPRLRLDPSALRHARLAVDRATAAFGLLAPGASMPRVAGLAPQRVPGAFEPFEIAVRAVLGQHVSVAAAITFTRRLVELCGPAVSVPGFDELGRAFPQAGELLAHDLSGIGITGARVAALRALAEAVVAGELDLEPGADPQMAREALRALPGFGDWTVEYIAMRALGDPDAFPAGDLVVRKWLAGDGRPPLTAAQARQRAEAWRPWRAHACTAIWNAATDAFGWSIAAAADENPPEQQVDR